MTTNHSRRSFLKTSVTAAAASLLPSSSLRASIAGLHLHAAQAAGTANAHRLSGGWEYLQATLGGPWEAWHSEEVAVWQNIAMPHCFNAYDGCDPDIPCYRGNGWYRTHVPIANPYPNGRTLLHFEGAGQTTTVYIGEKLAGKHVGGYDEFVFDITDLLPAAAPAALAGDASAISKPKTKKPDGVPIAILCDNSRDLDRMPSDFSDFTLYGGLYRHVNLVYVPAVSFETVHIRTDLPTPTRPAKITVVGNIYNPANSADSLNISVDITDAKGASIHHSQHTLKPWQGRCRTSPPSPSTNRTSGVPSTRISTSAASRSSPELPAETISQENFGIRHTEWVQHGPFKLNGERLLLRGTHRHEDHAGYAAAMPDDLLDQEMQLIKDVGANFIRLAHYQQSRRVLELCDRLGILVWEEIPWCRGGIGDDIFKEMGRRTLRNMIAQHYNHPSILLWGLGNEDDWPTEYPEHRPAGHPRLSLRAQHALARTRPLAPHHHPPLRLRPRHPRRLLALHLGGLVQRHLPRVSKVPRDPARTRQPSSSTPSGEPTATPAATPKTPTKLSRRSPPAKAPTSAASPTSTPAAPRASPATATGPRPTPATSSTGTSKCRRRSRGSPAPPSGSSRTSPPPSA